MLSEVGWGGDEGGMPNLLVSSVALDCGEKVNSHTWEIVLGNSAAYFV